MKESILELSFKLLSSYTLCDHCLGRQFAQLLTGTSNEERGRHIRYITAMYIDTLEEYEDKHNNFASFEFHNCKVLRKNNNVKECFICGGIFDRVNEIANNILKIIEGYEYSTFLVGIVPKKEMILNEEKIWEEIGVEYVEPLKEELSREIGKKVHERTGKNVDFEKPDITIIVDLDKNLIKKMVKSLYIYGRYNKYVEIPQTKWICSFCNGIGCEKCGYTGKRYTESVEELIGNVLLKHTKGIDTSFHGAGREDINALCYGWREFVIEIHEPKIRSIDLAKIEEEINSINKGKIEVRDLRFSDAQEVKKIKEKRDNKIYLAEIICEKPFTKQDIKILEEIKDLVINQQTPERVIHRRADKIRRRKIFFVKVLKVNKNEAKIRIKAEAGTYIKEFIHGDNGRTRPSVSSLLGKKCDVKRLIVERFEENGDKK